jgi:predicted nucleic acid-binding Zn ribbon protein
MNPISSAVPGAIAAMLRAAPLSAGKVDFAWKVAVGPALHRVTSVRLQDGLLIVEAADRHWAREVSRSTRVILARLQSLLGEAVVTGITVRTVD